MLVSAAKVNSKQLRLRSSVWGATALVRQTKQLSTVERCEVVGGWTPEEREASGGRFAPRSRALWTRTVESDRTTSNDAEEKQEQVG